MNYYTIRNILRGQSSNTMPVDDFRVIDSYAIYDDNKDKDALERELKYLCYEIESINPETGEKLHFYKALKFVRIIRLPKAAKQSTSFMDQQSQILSSVYENGYNLVTIIANIIKPVPLGLLFLYGVQGVGKDIEEAKAQADSDFIGLTSSLQSTFRVLEMKIINAQQTEWLREKMFNMEYMTVVRGIPKANTSGEDMGNKGMGGKNLNPDSQGTLEEFIAGMADYEYVVQVLSSPVKWSTLEDWQAQTEKHMTDWNSQLQGTSALSFNISMPMMYAANQSSSEGWSKGYTDADSVTTSLGESFSTSDGQSVSESISQSYSESFGLNESTSVSDSVSHSQSISTGETFGQTHGQTFGQSISQNASVNMNVSQGSSLGQSHSVNQSTNDSVSMSQGQTSSQTYSQNASTNVSTNHNVGTNQSVSATTSETIGQTESAGKTQTGTQTESLALSQNWGTAFGKSYNYTQNSSQTGSIGGSVNMATGGSHSITSGGSVGGGYTLNSGANIQIPFIGAGLSGGAGTTENFQVNGSETNATTYSGTLGYTVNAGFANGESLGIGLNATQNYGFGVTSSGSASLSTGITQTESVSQTFGMSSSETYGASESYGTSHGQSFGSSYGLSDSVSASQSITSGISSGWGNTLSKTDSITSSNGYSQGQGITSSVSNSVSNSHSISQSISEGVTTGKSVGSTQGSSYTKGTSNGITTGKSTSETVTQGTSNSTSTGSSKSISTGASGAYVSGSSSSMGFGPSIGYNKSYQWLDQQVKDILELLEYKNERYKKSLRGEGAFYTYVYIACPSQDALSAAQAVAKSTWQNEKAMITPLQVLRLTNEEQKHLLYHFSAFSNDITRTNVEGIMQYKYCTVLLPHEYVAYTHLPRVTEGGIFADINDIPIFAVQSMLKGEIYMGTILNAGRHTLHNGYSTPYDFRIDESELMHGFFTGASRSGKTVAAMRFVAELSRVRRKNTGKRLRIVCMDPKQDWRTLARFVDPERFRFYSLGKCSFRPVYINPFKIPKGVEPQTWIDGVIDIYCRAYGLLERGKQMMGETIYQLYEEAGVFEARDSSADKWEDLVVERSKEVTFAKVYERMSKIKAFLEDPSNPKGRAGNDTRDAYARLLDRLQCFSRPFSVEYKLFGTSKGIGIDELIGDDDVTILESSGLEKTFKNFIFGVITSGFYKYAKAHEGGYLAKDQYETVLVIEEANEVLIGNDCAGSGAGASMGMTVAGQSEFEEILDQSAGYGLFIIAITQKIADMPKSIVANSGLVFAGRLKTPDDITVVVRSVAREERYDDRDLVKWFPRMATGMFVCQRSRTFDFKDAEPILVQIARLNAVPPSNLEIDEILTVQEAKQQQSEWLSTIVA